MNDSQPRQRPQQLAASQSENNTQPRVELHIERLILDGLPTINRAQLGVVIQQELSRLMLEGGVSAALVQSGNIAQLDGGAFQVAPGAGTQQIGMQIARALYGRLGQ